MAPLAIWLLWGLHRNHLTTVWPLNALSRYLESCAGLSGMRLQCLCSPVSNVWLHIREVHTLRSARDEHHEVLESHLWLLCLLVHPETLDLLVINDDLRRNWPRWNICQEITFTLWLIWQDCILSYCPNGYLLS